MRDESGARRYVPACALLLVLTVALVSLSPSVVAQQRERTDEAEVLGNPDIELAVQENRLQPGTTQTVTIQVSNSGDIDQAGPSDLERRVQTARNARFEIDRSRLPAGIDVRSGPILAGSLPDGTVRTVSFTLDVPEGVEPGVYRVPVEVSYDYTRLARRTADETTVFRDFTRDRVEYVRMIVEDDAYFSVSAIPSDSAVVAGETGEFVFKLENRGTRTAYTPRVTLTSTQPSIFLGGQQGTTTKTVGTEPLGPGESRRISVTASAAPDLDPSMYPVNVEVAYETRGGISRTSRPMTVLLNTSDEQTFVTEGVTSTLEVGDEGDLEGVIRNRGPRSVSGAVVLFDPENRNVNPRETEYAVGDLGVGESARFDFSVAVSSEAESGPRRSEMRVEYRNAEGNLVTSEPVDVGYGISPDTDEFSLDSDIHIAAGSSESVDITLTNRRDTTLTDIQAKMFTDSPISSGDDEAFVPELGPNESTTVTFSVEASGGATPKTYSASIDFRYDDEDGDTEISDTYRVPVNVTSADEGGAPVALLAVAGLAVAVSIAWWKRESIAGSLGAGADDSE